MHRLSATEFKAKCLAVLDEVARTGEGVTVTKRGHPVAQVLPVVPRHQGYPQDRLRGTVEVLGNILDPVLPMGAWEALAKRK
ncbi:MAG: type II toxin-antitoxin system Phd/YefM family antitoxin [Candidatus Riflebacteria bacterium]|nr:type II toxin-antitoxin system Phd/YefM family antitoxin [Candidatus Riflebacteria bacterium]